MCARTFEPITYVCVTARGLLGFYLSFTLKPNVYVLLVIPHFVGKYFIAYNHCSYPFLDQHSKRPIMHLRSWHTAVARHVSSRGQVTCYLKGDHSFVPATAANWGGGEKINQQDLRLEGTNSDLHSICLASANHAKAANADVSPMSGTKIADSFLIGSI